MILSFHGRVWAKLVEFYAKSAFPPKKPKSLDARKEVLSTTGKETDLLRECVYSEEASPSARHFHNAHELIYVCEGHPRIQIGAESYPAEAGSLFFISKLEEHSVDGGGFPYRRYYLQLTPLQLDRMISAPELKSVFVSRPPGFCHRFSLEGAAPELNRLFAALEREWREPAAYSRPYTAALFSELLILCYRLRREQFPRPGREFRSAVIRAQEYIDRHFTEEITVAGLAKQFFLSVSHFSHAFKAWTGHSPQRYLLLSRISCAKELLLNTDGTVAQIAAQCGFGDAGGFTRAFRQECGLPPRRYRQESREQPHLRMDERPGQARPQNRKDGI